MSRAPVSCVISSFNKRRDLLANLAALEQQTLQPFEVIVIDNASQDGSAEAVRSAYPRVRLTVMPHSRFGACETFNLGFRQATQPFIAILDDDVVLPPHWIERLLQRFREEPPTTALITTKVVEPGTPDAYLHRDDVSREHYLSTFRGCGSLARREVLLQAGLYDERFFIYGNERDLAARILNLGGRILLHPGVITFHGTPFGMKAGGRSLYYHVRNFWLYAFKHCTWGDMLGAASALARRALWPGSEAEAAQATGTIGLHQAVRHTPGGLWIAVKATLAALCNLPYCLRHRRVCKAPDFKTPLS